jgi:hypothetical protein
MTDIRRNVRRVVESVDVLRRVPSRQLVEPVAAGQAERAV